MTKKERREIGEGIVSYEARKGPGDVARENAWCLFLILASAAALFSASESFRDWKVWISSAFAALLALLNATAVCERLVLFRGLGVQVRYSVQGVFWGKVSFRVSPHPDPEPSFRRPV